MLNNTDTNRCFMRFRDRAERITAEQVAETFVSVGPLMDVLESHNNQIMYGRRGTGKTHALRYFATQRSRAGDIAIYIDCQNLGSNGSIYNDTTIEVPERASRLLVDVCTAIHSELLDVFTDPRSNWDLAKATPILDSFIDRAMETRVVGSVENETTDRGKGFTNSSAGLSATIGATPSLGGKFDSSEGTEHEETRRQRQSGQEQTWIDFNFFSRGVRKLAQFVGNARIWILLDEWSTVPGDIQPYLADLIRRAMFSVPNISVKIAAIEHRSNFRIEKSDGGYIGMELGADVTPAINLDDYLVFDHNEDRAKQFFSNFLNNHVRAIAKEIGLDVSAAEDVARIAFTQENVFTEFVKSTEGVPRDAMYILSLVAQQAMNSTISMPALREAALTFYQKDKYSVIQTNPDNRQLLDWIRDSVIGQRRTRAFLLPVGTADPIIERLFDQRALHIYSRSMSAAHRPGERFIVYKLDYGCYIDLVNTDKFPDSLLIEGDTGDAANDNVMFLVPDDDARSYRRAILDLNEFYEAKAAESARLL